MLQELVEARERNTEGREARWLAKREIVSHLAKTRHQPSQDVGAVRLVKVSNGAIPWEADYPKNPKRRRKDHFDRDFNK
ncbi:unnamed protein product [Haemonchus placei]|uniref:Uncharacterized protein n=1 Tax=Haemonchus placei TaxID=6290 RepID=A0A0N4WBP9_HAEPC|nr:unnamed protein product [Haemonchus placei]